MPDRTDQSFPPALRFRVPRDYRLAREQGRKFHTPHFLVYVAKKPGGPPRLGITVSRKVGGAVERNRVKRLLREFFRLNQADLPTGAELSIIAKKGAPALDLRRVCGELNFLCGTESS